MSKLFYIILFSLILSNGLNAQNIHYQCGTDEHLETQKLLFPGLKQIQEKADRLSRNYKPRASKKEDTTLRIIPVVVHVIHNYGPENISKKDILEQIETLNANFNQSTIDSQNIPKIFRDRVANMRYKFVLATKDPNGNCTDGIVRVQSKRTYGANDLAKYVSYWDSKKYFNVWIINYIDKVKNPKEGITLGYAQFPYQQASQSKTDGVILAYWTFVKGNRTLTHEAGHWLGLYHPFQGGCATGGDEVDDTPPSKEANFGCILNLNSCSTDVPNEIDNIQNFMDYSDCTYMFTKGQKVRCDSFVQMYRSYIISDANLKATGTLNPSSTNCIPIADFSPTFNSVCQGSTVQFQDLSYNAIPNAWDWSFSNGTPNSSKSQNVSVKFDEPGQHSVTLKASNNNGSNEVTRTNSIKVIASKGDYYSPYTQNFENFTKISEERFSTDNEPYIYTNNWEVSNNVGYQSSKSLYVENNLNTKNGIVTSFITPTVDMTSSTLSQLKFKYAYGPKYKTSVDKLRILISKDCGQTWITMFSKQGVELNSTPSYFINDFKPRDTGDWKQVTLNLNAFKKITNLIAKFEFTTGGGNNIYIDDINLGGGTVGIESNQEILPQIKLSPNPNSTGKVQVNVSGINFRQMQLFILDINGKEILQFPSYQGNGLENQFEINLYDYQLVKKGLYFIKFNFDNGLISTQKLIIN